MTSQAPEVFIYNGQAFDSNDEPLSYLLEQRGLKKRFSLDSPSACWRGYIGTWHITQRKLFLIELIHASVFKEIKLTVLFPECETRVFAHWFTGSIQLPFGAEVRESDMIMRMVIDPEMYEGYHELKFEKGILIAEREVTNPIAMQHG
jgi:hypothetical protein